MKAAVFSRIGETPVLCELRDPIAQAGDVVIDVVAAPVLAYQITEFGLAEIADAIDYATQSGTFDRTVLRM